MMLDGRCIMWNATPCRHIIRDSIDILVLLLVKIN